MVSPIKIPRGERDVILDHLYQDVDIAVRHTDMLMGGIRVNLEELGTTGLLTYAYNFLHRLLVDPLQEEGPGKDGTTEPVAMATAITKQRPNVKRLRWSDGQLSQGGNKTDIELQEFDDDEETDPCLNHHRMFTLRQYTFNLHIMEHKLRNLSNLCLIHLSGDDHQLPANQKLRSTLDRLHVAQTDRHSFIQKYAFEMSTFLSKSPTLTPMRRRPRKIRRKGFRRLFGGGTAEPIAVGTKRLRSDDD